MCQHVDFQDTDLLSIHSSDISFSCEIRATHINLLIDISSVPTMNLDAFNEKLTASLKRIVESGIDMKRMAMLLNRDERQVGGLHSN